MGSRSRFLGQCVAQNSRFVKPKCGAKRRANSRFFGQDLGGTPVFVFFSHVFCTFKHFGGILCGIVEVVFKILAFFGQDSRLLLGQDVGATCGAKF